MILALVLSLTAFIPGSYTGTITTVYKGQGHVVDLEANIAVIGDQAKIEMTSKNGQSTITPKIDDYGVLELKLDEEGDFAGGYLSETMMIIAYYSKKDEVIISFVLTGW